jgi:FtsP/CotA-like multicopper oxidase with cupredoxin domain
MNRRELVRSAIWTAAAFSLPAPIVSYAASGVSPGPASRSESTRILRIVRRTIEVNGRAASVFGLVQADGAHGLSLRSGELFDVDLRNDTSEPTIVHWHGLTPPWNQDGVPDAPLPLIAATNNRQYRFPVGRAGTHWMHAHTLQEQNLLAAPLIVDDPAERRRDEQQVVILLHDFSFSTAEELLARLKSGGEHGGMSGMDHSSMGHGPAAAQSAPVTAAMDMDLNDIDYDAYLANDRTLDDPEIVKVEPGGRVRLRIINGATATAFTIDLDTIEGTLTAVDGQDVEPLKGRRFPISMGQRLDIAVELPRDNRAFPILALREGALERTGIVLVPANAPVRKIASVGQTAGPVLDLTLEEALRAAEPIASRQPDSRFDMALTGAMEGYEWGLETKPKIVVRQNDRVEVTMLNTSMMAHPMHLHGHHFQVVGIDGRNLPGAVRDTVHVPPRRSVTIAFDAVNPGQWAFHCHHLYHMAAGMMATVDYET